MAILNRLKRLECELKPHPKIYVHWRDSLDIEYELPDRPDEKHYVIQWDLEGEALSLGDAHG